MYRRRTTRLYRVLGLPRTRRGHNLLVVKLTVSIGFLALLVLPHEYKEWASLAVSYLWLWKGE